MTKVFATSLVLLALAAATPQPATERVTSVSDGDTFVALSADGAKRTVRLGEIDAPERGQAHADESRKQLADLVAQKYVRIETQDVDRYGRTVARVWVGAVDVNAELVRNGSAWAYRKFV